MFEWENGRKSLIAFWHNEFDVISSALKLNCVYRIVYLAALMPNAINPCLYL